MFRPLLLAALLPLTAYAATESATLDVSLTIKESCRIERHGRDAAPPQVSCALDSPYRVQASDASSAPSARRQLAPAHWEVIF
jgi:hypothetical protein